MISAGYKSTYQQGYSDAMCDFRKEPRTAILDKIRAEIEKQYKWLLSAEVTTCNIDIAFDAIRKAVESEKE